MLSKRVTEYAENMVDAPLIASRGPFNNNGAVSGLGTLKNFVIGISRKRFERDSFVVMDSDPIAD